MFCQYKYGYDTKLTDNLLATNNYKNVLSKDNPLIEDPYIKFNSLVYLNIKAYISDWRFLFLACVNGDRYLDCLPQSNICCRSTFETIFVF